MARVSDRPPELPNRQIPFSDAFKSSSSSAGRRTRHASRINFRPPSGLGVAVNKSALSFPASGSSFPRADSRSARTTPTTGSVHTRRSPT